MHRGNFSKQKFLDLKRMESKEEVVIVDNENQSCKTNLTNSQEEEVELSVTIIPEQITKDESAQIEMVEDDFEFSQKEKVNGIVNPFAKNCSEIIVQSNKAEEINSNKKQLSTVLLFKRASLFFILGFALILWAVVGLYKPFLNEGGAFVSFMLGLIALLVSAIFATKGMTKSTNQGSKTHKGARKEFVLFFGIFFIALSLLIVHGKI